MPVIPATTIAIPAIPVAAPETGTRLIIPMLTDKASIISDNELATFRTLSVGIPDKIVKIPPIATTTIDIERIASSDPLANLEAPIAILISPMTPDIANVAFLIPSDDCPDNTYSEAAIAPIATDIDNTDAHAPFEFFNAENASDKAATTAPSPTADVSILFVSRSVKTANDPVIERRTKDIAFIAPSDPVNPFA